MVVALLAPAGRARPGPSPSVLLLRFGLVGLEQVLIKKYENIHSFNNF